MKDSQKLRALADRMDNYITATGVRPNGDLVPMNSALTVNNMLAGCGVTTDDLRRIADEMEKTVSDEEIDVVIEFAVKVARAMNELKSSHVYFVMQQAYGEELDWGEAEGIFATIQQYSEKLTGK